MSHQHRSSADRFLPRRALEAVPWPVYGFDRAGTLEWWNDSLAATTGYTDAELGDLTAADLFATGADDLVDPATAEGEPGAWWELDAPLVTRDGRELPCHHAVALATRGDGTVAGVVGLARARTSDGPDALERRTRTYRALVETLSTASLRLATATTRGDVAATACDVLADSPLYDAAWVARPGDDGVDPVASAGTTRETAEAVATAWAADDAASPVDRAVEADRAVVHAGEATTFAVAPVADRASSHGVVVIETDRAEAPDDVERRALEGVGAVLGLATTQARAERLVLSEPGVELEFRLTDPSVPLVRLARELGATGHLAWMRREANGEVTQCFELRGADTEPVVAAFESDPNVLACRPVDGEPALFEVRLERCAAGELLGAGATVRDIATTNDGATLTVLATAGTDVRAVVDRLESVYPAVELVARRSVDGPETVEERLHAGVELTERQRDVLSTAFASGYFEWPRDATAEAVAEELGVSAATLHYHLRQAEQALVRSFLGEAE